MNKDTIVNLFNKMRLFIEKLWEKFKDSDFLFDKNMNLSEFQKINHILTTIFVFFAVITPADSLGLKISSFILILFLNIDVIVKKSFERKFRLVGFHVFIFPLILLVLSILMGGTLYLTISNIYMATYAGIIIVIFNNKINYERKLLNTLLIASLIIVFIASFDLLRILDLYDNSLAMYLHNSSEAMIGKSPQYWSYYVIFLKASPLILILLGNALHERNYKVAALATAALFLSGTRANLFAALILIATYVVNIKDKKIKIEKNIKVMLVALPLLILLLFYERIYGYISYIFLSKASSDLNKLGDLNEIISTFIRYPLAIITGTGFGTDSKFGIINGTSELALFDLWRKNGLIGLTIFLYFVLKPIRSLWRDRINRKYIYMYLSYLLVAMTNPLFFSSTAYIMYIYIYIIYYKNLRLDDDKHIESLIYRYIKEKSRIFKSNIVEIYHQKKNRKFQV